MADHNQLIVENSSDEEDDPCLYIDEDVLDSTTDSWQQSTTKSINTGNPFEIDLILLASLNRCQTRSSQTILTSNTHFLSKRHRSTFCQAEYFATQTTETNTEQKRLEVEEERVIVKMKNKINS